MNKNYCDTKKPLTCPSCFNQLAFTYKQINIDNNYNSYLVTKPININVLETKVIRNR